jgi:peptidoglycan LD-endopeptidase CwlK
MDYFQRIDTSLIYPKLLKKSQQLQVNCLAREAEYWATSGLRSIEEQNKLYALGRTTPNVDATPEKPMGGTVTNAKGGQSYHNFGLAMDFALDKNTARAGLQPDWRPEAYIILGEEAAKLDIEWGGLWRAFKDYPHVQVPLAKLGLSLKDVNQWYAQGGMANVWKQLDAYDW